MEKRLNLEGDIYQCKIDGGYHEDSGRYRVDNDVGYYYQNYVNKHYGGNGVISNKAGEKYFFIFHKEASDKINSLERAIFDFDGFSNDLVGPRLVDIALMGILSEISKSKDTILPHIILPEINSDKLVECGIIPDYNGQIYLQFPIQESI
jgi:hypothetical protein